MPLKIIIYLGISQLPAERKRQINGDYLVNRIFSLKSHYHDSRYFLPEYEFCWHHITRSPPDCAHQPAKYSFLYEEIRLNIERMNSEITPSHCGCEPANNNVKKKICSGFTSRRQKKRPVFAAGVRYYPYFLATATPLTRARPRATHRQLLTTSPYRDCAVYVSLPGANDLQK